MSRKKSFAAAGSPPRRSPRILSLINIPRESQDSTEKEEHEEDEEEASRRKNPRDSVTDVSKKPGSVDGSCKLRRSPRFSIVGFSDVRSEKLVECRLGDRLNSKKSPGSNGSIDLTRTIRRSPRFLSGGSSDEKKTKEKMVSFSWVENVSDKCEKIRVLSDGRKSETSVALNDRICSSRRKSCIFRETQAVNVASDDRICSSRRKSCILPENKSNVNKEQASAFSSETRKSVLCVNGSPDGNAASSSGGVAQIDRRISRIVSSIGGECETVVGSCGEMILKCHAGLRGSSGPIVIKEGEKSGVLPEIERMGVALDDRISHSRRRKSCVLQETEQKVIDADAEKASVFPNEEKRRNSRKSIVGVAEIDRRITRSMSVGSVRECAYKEVDLIGEDHEIVLGLCAQMRFKSDGNSMGSAGPVVVKGGQRSCVLPDIGTIGVASNRRICRRSRKSYILPETEPIVVETYKEKVSIFSKEEKRRKRRKSAVGVAEIDRRKTRSTSSGFARECTYKEVDMIGEEGEIVMEPCAEMTLKSNSSTRGPSSQVAVNEVREMKERDFNKSSQENCLTIKRKHDEEGNDVCQGWTEEQELALQRAYFTAKPSPHFWKKVAKMVPGKSAQECFDKLHSAHITPHQAWPRSRPSKTNLSPIQQFSLSASKLLEPTKLKTKRFGCSKKKRSHLAQKTVRKLLEKQCHVNQGHELDLFSVLEPRTMSNIPSTPKGESGVPQKFQEGSSSSGYKRPSSRFISSCATTIFSPPVLKQVKNKALHEKYIDQLHCREAKRKAESAKVFGKENDEPLVNIQKMDSVKAAKDALIFDVKDAIDKLQGLQADNSSNYSDFDCDHGESDDGGEIDL